MGIGKLIIGIVLVIASLYVIWQYTRIELWTVLKGLIPPLIFILGIFMVWLEMDEMKSGKEASRSRKK